MTIAYGLTATGFVPKTQDVVRTELIASFQAAFGLSIDVSPASLLGEFIGILAEREGLLWSLAQAVNASMDPNAATGSALAALAALTGTFATAASPSNVTLTLTGTPTTVVNAGSQAKTASTGSVFATTAGATITLLASWAPLSPYALGARVTNGGNAYQCAAAGTSSPTGGPSGSSSAILDGSVTWLYLGGGAGAVDVAAASLLNGPIVGVSGDITVIQTPVGGWTSVRNVLDAVVGANVMTDAQLRVLRVAELAAAGVATQNAIRAALLQVSGVQSVTVFVNNTDLTNSDGMPPHSVEALVQATVGATFDQAILNCLFASVAAGIAYQGTTVGTVVDSQGVLQTVRFTRPANVLIFDDVTIVYDPLVYVPATGDLAVAAAIAAYGGTQPTGKDVVSSSLAAAVLPTFVGGVLVAGVAGVLDVVQVLTHTAAISQTPTAWQPSTSYTQGASFVTNDGRTFVCTTSGISAAVGSGPSTNGAAILDGSAVWRSLTSTIPITTRQLAVHDTSRITVHSSAGVP